MVTAAVIPGKQTGSDHFHSTRQGQAHVGVMLSQGTNLVSTAMSEVVSPVSHGVPSEHRCLTLALVPIIP